MDPPIDNRQRTIKGNSGDSAHLRKTKKYLLLVIAYAFSAALLFEAFKHLLVPSETTRKISLPLSSFDDGTGRTVVSASLTTASNCQSALAAKDAEIGRLREEPKALLSKLAIKDSEIARLKDESKLLAHQLAAKDEEIFRLGKLHKAHGGLNASKKKTIYDRSSISFPPGCNWTCYFDSNPKLLEQLDRTEEAAISHYAAHGTSEGRECSCDRKQLTSVDYGNGEDAQLPSFIFTLTNMVAGMASGASRTSQSRLVDTLEVPKLVTSFVQKLHDRSNFVGTSGVLFLVSGNNADSHLRECTMAAAVLRARGCKGVDGERPLHVTAFTDARVHRLFKERGLDELDIFDNVTVIPEMTAIGSNPFLPKLVGFLHTPYDYTLFLDCDVIAMKAAAPAEMLDLTRRAATDIVVTADWTQAGYNGDGTFGKGLPGICTSVVAWANVQPVRDLWEDSIDLLLEHEGEREREWDSIGLQHSDQEAVYLSLRNDAHAAIQVHKLPLEWRCPTLLPGASMNPSIGQTRICRFVHYHPNSHVQALEKITELLQSLPSWQKTHSATRAAIETKFQQTSDDPSNDDCNCILISSQGGVGSSAFMDNVYAFSRKRLKSIMIQGVIDTNAVPIICINDPHDHDRLKHKPATYFEYHDKGRISGISSNGQIRCFRKALVIVGDPLHTIESVYRRFNIVHINKMKSNAGLGWYPENTTLSEIFTLIDKTGQDGTGLTHYIMSWYNASQDPISWPEIRLVTTQMLYESAAKYAEWLGIGSHELDKFRALSYTPQDRVNEQSSAPPSVLSALAPATKIVDGLATKEQSVSLRSKNASSSQGARRLPSRQKVRSMEGL